MECSHKFVDSDRCLHCGQTELALLRKERAELLRTVALQTEELGDLRAFREGAGRTRDKHPLHVDARLQFWRECYESALAARLRTVPLGFDQQRLIEVADAVALSADLALASLLMRCRPGAIDETVDAMLALVRRQER